MPSAASRRSFFDPLGPRRPSGRRRRRGYTRSARSQSRSRPTRPAIAISPRIIRNSSICVTLRLFVQPVEAHGTTHVSGMSRELSGPELPSSFEDVAPEAVVVAEPGTRALVASATRPRRRGTRPRSLIGRTSALCSNSVRSCLERLLEVLGLGTPSRGGSRRRGPRSARSPPSGRSAAASAARTTASRSVGRGASSSCARTAMRRACAFVSRCTRWRLAVPHGYTCVSQPALPFLPWPRSRASGRSPRSIPASSRSSRPGSASATRTSRSSPS